MSTVQRCNAQGCATRTIGDRCYVCKTSISMTEPHYVVGVMLFCDTCAVAFVIAEGGET